LLFSSKQWESSSLGRATRRSVILAQVGVDKRPGRTEAKDGGRRFTRLTNGFSKKLENHEHALALYFMHYNFCRIHRTLRVTSAMEAGITDHVWSLDEVIDLP